MLLPQQFLVSRLSGYGGRGWIFHIVSAHAFEDVHTRCQHPLRPRQKEGFILVDEVVARSW